MAENNVFVNIDFSQSNGVDKALESEDIETAKQESQKVLKIRDEIVNNAKSVGGKTIFDSSINLMVYVPYDKELIESFSDVYEQYLGQPTNMGIGRTPIESHDSLDIIQARCVGQIILYSSDIRENLAENRKFYRQAEKGKQDLKIANVIKAALLELNIITREQKVYDIFLRLVKEHGLDTIEALQSFFYKPLEELKDDIRNVYEKQATAGVIYAVGPQMFPGQAVVLKGRQQKSPHRRHNWWSIEEYNQDAVDYRKTDMQYIDDNISKDSQDMSMGGEPGNAISVT